jgi:hypothetical protein
MQAGSELRQAHRTAALIAGGLITSLVMYAIVANVFRMTQSPFSGMAGLPEAHLRAARYAAWMASAAVVLALPVIRRGLLRRRPDDTRAAAIARLTFSSVAVGGLAELPAVSGFVLVILGGLFLDFYLLGSLSLMLMLANFPRYDAWEEWLAAPAPRP